jgi:hypothetical protein
MVKIFISLWQVLAYFVMVISQIHTESIPLTVVTSLATSFSIDPSQSPEICYFKWSKLDLNPKFAVKTRDELAWFELIQEHQKPSIVRIEETPRSQTTQDVLVSESLQCWQTKRESVRGEDRWVSESTDDYLMLQCEAESCTFSKRTTSTDSFSNRILLNPANLTSFALMTPYTFILLRVDSRSNSAVIELYETNTENAKIRSNRRQLALGDTAVDSTKVLSSGSTMPITLTCDSRAVTSCLLQCPGKPYALFNSASGVCDPCVGAGFIQWDKTMSCQKCDTANNGVTIGHWWDIAGAVGPICKVCHSSCKTCSGPLASDCNLCWEDTTVNYFTTAGLKLAKAVYETTVGSEMSRRMLVAITCSASNTGCVANCASCKVGNSSFCLHPLSGFYLTQDHTLGCNAGATGVYKYQIANGDVCGSCPPRCTNCVNSYTCTSCQVGYPYFDPVAISCVASCPTGFFPAVGNICQACHSSCATCQGPGPAECLTCNASLSYTMKLSSVQADTAPFSCRNSAGCPTYTWPDYTNGICRHCEPSCATCSGSLATQCLTCPASNYLYSDNHCGTCGGAGVTVSGPNCVPCAGSCATCQAGMPSYCLTCTVDLYLNSGAHTCTLCNTPGYFISGSNCVNCNPSCYACSTSGTSACTQCHSGYGLSSTAPSSCVMCTGPNQYIDRQEFARLVQVANT